MSKKFLTRQTESIPEYAVQIRDDEPLSPVDNQPYYNSSTKKLKLKTSSNTFVLSEADNQRNTELTSKTIDLSQTETAQTYLSQFIQDSITPRSMVFDGNTKFITAFPSASLHEGNSGNFAISLWISVDSPVLQQVFEYGNMSLIWDSGSNTFILQVGPDTLPTASTISTGIFYHLTLSFTSSTMSIFVDGLLEGTTTHGGITPSNPEFYLGYGTASMDFFMGKMASIIFWNRNIQEEAFILYKRGYTSSPDFLYNYDLSDLRGNYLMGDLYNYIFNISSAQQKTYTLKIHNDTQKPCAVSVQLTPPLAYTGFSNEGASDELEIDTHRVIKTNIISNNVTSEYRDNPLFTQIYSEETIYGTLPFDGNKRAGHSTIPTTPVLDLSCILESGAYLSTTPTAATTSLSFSFWVKFDPTQNPQQVITYGNLELYINGTTLYLKKGTLITGTVTFDLSNPANQTWQHFTVTWSYNGPGTGNLFLYKNGVQVVGLTGNNDDGDFGLTPSGVFYLGAKLSPGPTAEIDASFANLEIWHDELSLAEASSLYSAGYYENPAVIVAKALAHHYLMGDTTEDMYTIIYDIIGTANLEIDTVLAQFSFDIP